MVYPHVQNHQETKVMEGVAQKNSRVVKKDSLKAERFCLGCCTVSPHVGGHRLDLCSDCFTHSDFVNIYRIQYLYCYRILYMLHITSLTAGVFVVGCVPLIRTMVLTAEKEWQWSNVSSVTNGVDLGHVDGNL